MSEEDDVLLRSAENGNSFLFSHYFPKISQTPDIGSTTPLLRLIFLHATLEHISKVEPTDSCSSLFHTENK